MKNEIVDWLINAEDQGISSKAMAAALLDKTPTARHDRYAPSDPSDFNRCLKFLIDIPQAKLHMDKIAAISDDWERLVNRWEEVEKCFLDEVGIDWAKGGHIRARKTYSLMKEIAYPTPKKEQ